MAQCSHCTPRHIASSHGMEWLDQRACGAYARAHPRLRASIGMLRELQPALCQRLKCCCVPVCYVVERRQAGMQTACTAGHHIITHHVEVRGLGGW